MNLSTKSRKLDVRMQISLSREHVERVKRLKPNSVTLSAYVRQAIEEKLASEMSKKMDPAAVIALLTSMHADGAPSVEEVNKRLLVLRQERILR